MPTSKNVLTLFKNIFLITSLSTSIIVSVFIAIPPDPTQYYQSSVHKVELLKNTPAPRIILFGGSNVAYGIDSSLIQEETGLPVINMALTAGLGVIPVREIEDYLQSNDIVIISLEYGIITEEQFTNGTASEFAKWLEYSPQRAKYLHRPVIELPKIYLIMLQNQVNRQASIFIHGGIDRGIYSSKNIDSHGDVVGHLDKPNVDPSTLRSTRYNVTPHLEYPYVFLENFNQYAQSINAHVFFEMPASRQTNCDATGIEDIKIFYDVFLEKTTIPILTPIDQLCFPDKYFFDSIYHLDATGRQIRTERIISGLRKNSPSLFAP